MNNTYGNVKEFTEGDWKLFRKKIAIWQEAYMNRLNEEYISILTQDKIPSEKFWELEKRIKVDKQKPGVLIEMSRSAMIMNIIALINDETIKMEDLADFSDILKERIQAILSRKRDWDLMSK